MNVVPFRASLKLKITLLVLVGIGVVSLRLLQLEDSSRAWYNYFIGSIFFLSMGLCGLFFTAIQHMTKARWSVGLRRVLEVMSLTLPVAAIFIYGVYRGSHHIYEWMHAGVEDHLLQWKQPFLNEHSFGIRLIAYFVIWILGSFWLFRNSVKQDQTGDVALTWRNLRFSALLLVLFGLSVTLAAFDLIMSLEPHWFSTIFGIYFFSGFFQAGLAMFYILAYLGYQSGTFKGVVTADHFHDIGRFIFGFSIFWAYIAFSQYLLIWYGNLPEETFFYIVRMEGGWQWVSLALLLVRFAAPFLILMPFAMKRSPKVMIPMSILILLGEWLDLYYIAMPARRLTLSLESIAPMFNWKELGVLLGFISLFVLLMSLMMERIRMVPVRDPRLEASVHYYHHG